MPRVYVEKASALPAFCPLYEVGTFDRRWIEMCVSISGRGAVERGGEREACLLSHSIFVLSSSYYFSESYLQRSSSSSAASVFSVRVELSIPWWCRDCFHFGEMGRSGVCSSYSIYSSYPPSFIYKHPEPGNFRSCYPIEMCFSSFHFRLQYRIMFFPYLHL